MCMCMCSATNCTLDSIGYDNVIAASICDLNPSLLTTSNIWVRKQPNNVTFLYDSIPHYDDDEAQNPITFAVTLHNTGRYDVIQ